jgi:acetyl-CoA acetyltransferase
MSLAFVVYLSLRLKRRSDGRDRVEILGSLCAFTAAFLASGLIMITKLLARYGILLAVRPMIVVECIIVVIGLAAALHSLSEHNRAATRSRMDN